MCRDETIRALRFVSNTTAFAWRPVLHVAEARVHEDRHGERGRQRADVRVGGVRLRVEVVREVPLVHDLARVGLELDDHVGDQLIGARELVGRLAAHRLREPADLQQLRADRDEVAVGHRMDLVVHRVDVDGDRVGPGDRAAVLVLRQPTELEATRPLVDDVAQDIDLPSAHVVVLVEDVAVVEHPGIADREWCLVVPDDVAFGVDTDEQAEVRRGLAGDRRGRRSRGDREQGDAGRHLRRVTRDRERRDLRRQRSGRERHRPALAVWPAESFAVTVKV